MKEETQREIDCAVRAIVEAAFAAARGGSWPRKRWAGRSWGIFQRIVPAAEAVAAKRR